MARVTLMLGLLLALSCTIATAGYATHTTPARSAAPARGSELDGQILRRLNATRVANGLRPLANSPELGAAAGAHSRDLIQAGVFQHDSPDGTSFVRRLKRFYSPSGYARWATGENLLYSTEAISADSAIKAWLDSPPHRRNLLDPSWREVGVGSVRASSPGGLFGDAPTWVVTVDFGVRSGLRTTAATHAR